MNEYKAVKEELDKQMGEGTYRGELAKAMRMLAKNDRVLFIGQTVSYPGSGLYSTLEGIAEVKRIELPVMEEVQMGMSIGLALEGYIPVSIYPRMDFLILATNMLVNHLDKIEEMSCGQFKPKVIIRTAIGATRPLYPGVQHIQDYTDALARMTENISIFKLTDAKSIIPYYKQALESKKSSLLVELSELYSENV